MTGPQASSAPAGAHELGKSSWNGTKRPGGATIAVSVGLIVAMWALNFIAAKIGLRHLEPLAMATFRVVLAGVVMVPAYFVSRRLPGFTQPGLPSQRFSARNLWVFAYLGFFGVVTNQICFTMGLRYTSVGHSAVIVGMGPVYILVLACLMRLERFTLRKAAGMAIAFAGVVLLATESNMGTHSPTLLGDLITMSGSVGFSLYAVLGKRVASEFDTLTMTAFNHFAGAALVLPVAAYEGWKIGAAANCASIGWESWTATANMAVFGSAAAYLL